MTWTNVHAIERAKIRYSLNIDRKDLGSVSLAIIDAAAGEGDATARLVEKGQSGREIWHVRLGYHFLVVVYSPETARVVTVLPRREDLEIKWVVGKINEVWPTGPLPDRREIGRTLGFSGELVGRAIHHMVNGTARTMRGR